MTHISPLEQPQEELFRYPLHLRYKVMTSTRRITVLDDDFNMIMYVHQQSNKWPEDVRVYDDQDRTTELFRIRADRAFGYRKRYSNYAGDTLLGSYRFRGFWPKPHYDIYDPSGAITYTLVNDNPWTVIGSLMLAVPLLLVVPALEMLGFAFKPSYTILDRHQLPVMRLQRKPGPTEDFIIHKLIDVLSPEEERHLLLTLLMLA